MATQPQQDATPPEPKKPVVVYHPRTPLDQLKRARGAHNWGERAMVLGAGAAMILVFTFFGTYIAPSLALLMYAAAGVSVVIIGTMGYMFVYWPVTTRAQLINDLWAMWLPPGDTREFYDTQTARIAQYVPEHHRTHVRASLFMNVLIMVRQEPVLYKPQLPSATPDDREKYNAATVNYELARRDALRVVDGYAEEEEPTD